MAATYDIRHTVEGGIERITYQPHQPQHETPIIMQHGMWHGAWCWEPWQKALAERGWESHAHSLPGHGQSPTQRPIRWCTLGYYLQFLRAEIERQPRKPILMGHSMGGALTQWYLKKVADDLPAAVLVASWNSHEMLSSMLMVSRRDPMGLLLMSTRWTATAALRTPKLAADMLISKNAIYTPEELQARVGPESMWVLMQYNPPLWRPKPKPHTPLLWLIPDADLAVIPANQARSAAFYNADVIHVPGGAHNLMMEATREALAEQIHEWLTKQVG